MKILLSIALLGAPSQQSGAPRIEWVAPPVEVPAELRDSVRFGYLTVPQDHDRPDGRTLRIAIAVLAARTAQPAADPLVLIPGGPGASEVRENIVRFARSPRIGLFRERRDFIVMEPRGHGYSEPRLCPGLEAPFIAGSAAAEAKLADRLRECRARLDADGIRPEMVSSVQAARDIELLRRALEAPQVNLIGGSYGARIAAEAMRQVPQALRAVNLVAPVPPGLPHLGDDDIVAEAALRTLFMRCAEQSACGAAYPRLEAEYESLLVSARRGALIAVMPRSDRLPEGMIRVDERVLRAGLAGLLAAPDLAAGIPLLIHTLANRGFGTAGRMAPWMAGLLEEEVAVGTQHAFWCNDHPVALETAEWLPARCRIWIGAAYGDTVGEPVRSDIPTLIQVGELDPRTPPSYARFVAQGLEAAYVIEIPWGGHGLREECSFRIAREFFDVPDRAPTTTCLDSLPPMPFVVGLVPSRWTGNIVMSATAHPLHVAIPGVGALVLLLVAVVGLPAYRLRGPPEPTGRVAIGVLWLAAAAALVLLIAFAAATFVGARRHLLIPALGVAPGWGWVLLLPWLVLGLAALAGVLVGRRLAGRRPLPGIRSLCAGVGIGLVLGLWAFHALG